MGFHKRYINDEGIIRRYESGGINALKTYFSADALIINGDFAMEIHDDIVKAKGNDDWNALENKINEHKKNVKLD